MSKIIYALIFCDNRQYSKAVKHYFTTEQDLTNAYMCLLALQRYEISDMKIHPFKSIDCSV